MRTYQPRLGDTSAFTWVTDRSKRSVALNLRDPRGVEAVRRLARDADAVVESFRPGVADRLGVGYDDLRELNPALVYCSISGYGADGPLVAEAGHDINYVGRAGLLSVTGAGGRPALPGVTIADLAGGSLMGIAGLLAALVRAQRTGEGDHVDVAMTDGAFALQALTLGAFFAEGRDPGIETELLNGGYPCYNVYECADGRHLTVGPLEEPFWRELCDAVERPDLLADPVRRARDPGLAGAVRHASARRLAGGLRRPRRVRRPAQQALRGDRRPAAAPPRDDHRAGAPARRGPCRRSARRSSSANGMPGRALPRRRSASRPRPCSPRRATHADEIERLLDDGVAAEPAAVNASDW